MNSAQQPEKPALEGLPEGDYTPSASGPLDGVLVMDLSKLVAGNILTQLLGDFGAEIVKVEPLSGDTLRAWKVKDVPTNWKLYGRNKKSIALDFRSPPARGLILSMISEAHVLIESFRPGTLEAMGLSPEQLWEVNPKLVIVRISGWGQSGPYVRRPGFGTLIEGMSGFASMNGFDDREPVLPPMYLADSVAGLYGASGVLVALREVEINGGKGQVIDLPLLDPLISVLGPQAANYQLTGAVKARTGSRSTNIAPRNAYRCSDGLWVGLSAATQAMAFRLFRAIGREDLIEDPKYCTNADRLANVEELDRIISAFIAERTQNETVKFFEAAEVSIGPIYDVRQVVSDSHVIERKILARYPDSEMGEFTMHHVVPRLSETPASIRSPAPKLGEHAYEILQRVGYSKESVDSLVDEGVLIVSSENDEV